MAQHRRNGDSQRNALFGARLGQTHGRPSAGATARGDTSMSHGVLQEENDRAIADLESRVGSLRNVASRLHGEVQESNSLLGSIAGEMEKTKQMLAGTMGNLRALAEGKGGRPIMMVVGFVLVIMFIMYLSTRSLLR